MTTPRTLLAAWNLRPKKNMGQNFLSDPSTAETIISRAHLSSEDVVLEIGAGLGALTIVLARVVKKVYAVEKDRQLIELLKTELLANRISNCEIIAKNILQMDLHAISRYDPEEKLRSSEICLTVSHHKFSSNSFNQEVPLNARFSCSRKNLHNALPRSPVAGITVE